MIKRKIICFILIFVLCLTLGACKRPQKQETASPTEVITTDPSEAKNKTEEAEVNDSVATVTKTEDDSTGSESKENSSPAKAEAEKTEKSAKEKNYLTVSSSKAHYTKEQLLEKGDLIVKVKVVSKDYETMANPDGTVTGRDGNIITNRQITGYTVEILETYKGAYTGKTLEVKTSNGDGLSPDLILYGEDETTILASPLVRFDLDVGAECILLLVNVEGENELTSGYFPFGPECGYFLLDKDGNYTNQSGTSPATLETATLAAEITALTAETK